ncbi:MAG TPA: MCE family protein [Jatrophihabitans sp.]|jgi:virulence factor Mce-like protein
MAGRSVAPKLRKRLAGLVFLVVLAGLLSLSVAAYQQKFTKVTLVTLDTDHTGAQLLPQSDVKLRGIIVGQVRKISTYQIPATGGQPPQTRAKVTMALQPGKTALIPFGTTALLLPKTLFGERFVALQVPTGLSGRDAEPVRGGDVLHGGKDAIEIEQVLNDLYPVLLALHPEDLKTTLTALATALQGRGKQLGDNLASLNDYLKKFNPKVPTLIDDIDKLGKVALEYNSAAPDLLGSLNNLATTSRTISTLPKALDNLLTSATSTSTTLDNFLNADGDRLIDITSTNAQVLAVLARYAPEYPCLAKGLADSEPREEQLFGGGQPALHITMELVKSQGKYVPGNEPKYPNDPAFQVGHCFGLPNPAVPFPGAQFPNNPGATDGAPYLNQMGTANRSAYNASGPGSPAESNLVSTLISSSFGGDPAKVPAIATVLAAPMLRGSVVSVK